ncbi:MAG TPA: polymer-forming cytoskeletal protein [Atribacteraceae bacterium]|nr:polymer-forming cytoskeletal protein [Atribacteraceae bacterium]
MDSTEEHKPLPDVAIFGDRVKTNGHFSSRGMVMIQGQHRGSMDCETIVVTRQGFLEADTVGETMEVWGTLGGFAQVRRVLCKKSATLTGYIMASAIALEPGVRVERGFAFPLFLEEENEIQTGH